MCTVTYIPTESGYLVCSNRDEQEDRPLAYLPKQNDYLSTGIWHPIDGAAGGSWIALKEDGQAAVLLNGAIEKHVSNPPYRKSRGVVFLSIAKQDQLLESFLNIALTDIEPFTMILLTKNGLFECLWNGIQKSHTKMDSKGPQIWSSCTLYDKELRKKRSDYFHDWIGMQQGKIDALAILAFHQSSPFKNSSENFKLKREDGISTVSITCLKKEADRATILYQDLRQADTMEIHWELNQLAKQTKNHVS